MNRILVLFLIPSLSAAAPAAAGEPAAPNYERDVRPILKRRCTVCHNVKKKGSVDVSGGLALDSFEAVQEGTARRPVAVPGDPARSELVKRLADPDEDVRMPLSEEPLSAADQDLIRRWIGAGMPRGRASAETPAAAKPSAAAAGRRNRRRMLEVLLPLELKLPDGTAGFAKGGMLQIAVKIGPLSPVAALALRGDGRLLAAGVHGRIVLWDLVGVRPVSVIDGFPGPVHALAFSRDGKRLAAGSGAPARSGAVRVFAVPGGELLHEFSGHDDVVFALAFRPDGGRIASASFDQTIRLWNLADGSAAGTFRGHSDFVEAIAFTPDGRSILSAGKDRTIKRIDADALKEVQSYSGHEDEVLALAVHPDGVHFVSAGAEPPIRWWTLDSSKPIRAQNGHSGPVHQMAFSRDGRRLISTGGDGSTRIWNGTTGAPLRSLKGTSEWKYSAVVADDGRIAAAGGWDGLIQVWDAESGALRGTLVQAPPLSAADSSGLGVDWLVATAGGRLDGSPAMLETIQGRIGANLVPAEVLRRACIDSERTIQAIRGEAVPPVEFKKP